MALFIPEFWIGLAVIPALAATFLLLQVLYAVSTWAWRRLHMAMLARIDLAPDPFDLKNPDKGVTHRKAANRVRNALLESPRLFTFHGFGWLILLVRDSKSTGKATRS